MIKIENTQVVGLEAAIRGMRNPMNSWEKSDSIFANLEDDDGHYLNGIPCIIFGIVSLAKWCMGL